MAKSKHIISQTQFYNFTNKQKNNFTGIIEDRVPGKSFLDRKTYIVNGLAHRIDGPAIECNDRYKYWCYQGKQLDVQSQEEFEAWLKKTHNIEITHELKENFTGITLLNGATLYHVNGFCHNESGPAFIADDYKTVYYYLNGISYSKTAYDKKIKELNKMKQEKSKDNFVKYDDIKEINNYTGCVFYTSDGAKSHFLNGVWHREDGPAVEYADGSKAWYLDGRYIAKTQEEFEKYLLTNNNLQEKKVGVNLQTKKRSEISDQELETYTGIVLYDDGSKEYLLNGKVHRTDGPAIEYPNGNKEWYLHGKRHRTDGPAVEYTNGYKVYLLNGQHHRTDGPAVEYADGSKAWYYQGQLIIYVNSQEEFEEYLKKKNLLQEKRVEENLQTKKLSKISHQEYKTYTGIALYEDGTKEYLLNGQRHRTDGPAIEYSNGTKYWYLHGQLHRSDGPAIEYAKGSKSWYYYDKCINVKSQEEFEKYLKNNNLQEKKVQENLQTKKRSEISDQELKIYTGVILYEDGTKEYLLNGQRHRTDGPAVEYANGYKSWYYQGRHINVSSQEEFEKYLKDQKKLVDEQLVNEVWYGKDTFDQLYKESKPTFNPCQEITNEEKKDSTMKTNNNGTVEMLKDDALDAAYRVAATQMVKGCKAATLAMFKKQKFSTARLRHVSDLLNDELGDMMISGALGVILTYTPQIKDDPRVQRLAKEFRVNTMATAGNMLMGIAMDNFLPVITNALSSLPLPEEKVRVNHVESEEEEEYNEEELHASVN